MKQIASQDIVLVSMPFAQEMSPSLGLSLLKASAARAGLEAEVLYFTLAFAEQIGVSSYSRICTDGARSIRERLGDWVFRPALFGSDEANDALYIRDVLDGRSVWPHKELARSFPRALLKRALAARSRVSRFMERCERAVLQRNPRIVGFTSTFQQHVASLALAKRLKERRPDLFIVFGGANCEGAMGLETVRSFPFVDAAVSGEGEVVFPELARRVLLGLPFEALPGVLSRSFAASTITDESVNAADSIAHLDDLPEPDFSDYFAQFQASPLSRVWEPGLFFETSRGCWWGKRSHCTFCGLNGGAMAYRSKSPERALTELEGLVKRFPGCDVQIVDNILDTAYFDTFLPELAKRKLGLRLFYETKANLRRDEVRKLSEAGIVGIQPGIESLSDPILRLMRKGISAIHNIQLLKWCKEYGVKPYWNLIWGFPGEPREEYERMAKLVPLLHHLQPPTGFTGLRLDRFSPYFVEPERFGISNVQPLTSYAHIYPLPETSLRNLAYFFSFQYRDGREPNEYVPVLLRALRLWQARFKESELLFLELDDDHAIFDLRSRRRPEVLLLSGLHGILHGLLDEAISVERLLARVRESKRTASLDDVQRALNDLSGCGLVVQDARSVMRLALPLRKVALSVGASARFAEFVRGTAHPTGDSFTIRLNGNQGIRRPVRPPSRVRSGPPTTPAPSENVFGPEAFHLSPSLDLVVRFPASLGAALR